MKNDWEKFLFKTGKLSSDDRRWIEYFRNGEALLIRFAQRPDRQTSELILRFIDKAPQDIFLPYAGNLYVRIFIRCGRILNRLGDWKNSGRCFQKAVEAGQKAADPRLFATALMELGDLERRKGKLDVSIKLNRKALKLAVSNVLAREHADAANNIAVVLVEMGRLREAAAQFHESLEMAERIEENRLIGHVYNNLGVILCMQGHFEEAVTEFKRALVYREAAQDKRGECETLHNLAMTFKDLNCPDEADSFVGKARDLALELSDLGLEANIGLTAIEVLILQQDFAFGLSLARKNLKLQKRLGDHPGAAETLHLMGLIALKQNKLEQAEKWLKKALSAFQKMDIALGRAECLRELSECYKVKGLPEKSLQMQKEAAALFLKMGNKEEAERLGLKTP